MKLKGGGIKYKVSSNLMATVWKDTQNVNILTNMNAPPKGNFCGECKKLL